MWEWISLTSSSWSLAGNPFIKISNCTCRKDFVSNRNIMTLRDWKGGLEAGSLFNCQKVRFIGGEHLLLGNDILELCSLAQGLGYESLKLSLF